MLPKNVIKITSQNFSILTLPIKIFDELYFTLSDF